MCGIVGYVGKRSAQDVLLDGLEKLEYRGYDSAGVALALDGGIRVVKSKGRLTALREKLAARQVCRTCCSRCSDRRSCRIWSSLRSPALR